MSNRKNDHLAWQQFRTRNPSAVLFRVIDPRLKTDGIEVHMADHVTTLIDPRHPLRQTKGNGTHFERHLSVDTEAVRAERDSDECRCQLRVAPYADLAGLRDALELHRRHTAFEVR